MAERVVNFTVHGIGPTCRELEPGEDATWVSVAQFEQVVDTLVGRENVRISFDDANLSDVEIALPRLRERGLTAEFFLLAGRFGEPGRLDESHVVQLLDAGMTVGSHGWSHRNWRELDRKSAEEEVWLAKRRLTDLTGVPVRSAAVPFGSYDRRVLQRLRLAGFDRVYTSDGGPAQFDAWLQPRNSLKCDIGPEWARRVIEETPPVKLRARRVAARVVKRWRGPLTGAVAYAMTAIPDPAVIQI